MQRGELLFQFLCAAAADERVDAPGLRVVQHLDLLWQGGQNVPDGTYTAAANAETLFADAAYPLIDRTKANLPPLLWKPTARWVASLAKPVAPTAALDLVPTGKPGQLKVVFHGAPLPKAKVELVSPSGWAREATSGDDGTVTFALPWKGQYVAEVKHSDKTPGEAQGQKYGEVSHLITLSFVHTEGMASPALPAAHAH